MIEVINNPWKDILLNYVSQTDKNIQICCPFIKLNVLKEIYDYKNQGVKFELITQFKVTNFYNQVSDVNAIDFILENKGIIRAFQKLHAKIFIFDYKSVVITSSNLTLQGLKGNYEYGIFTDEPIIVNKVCNDFDKLTSDKSCIKINKDNVVDAYNIIKNAPPRSPIKLDSIYLGKKQVQEVQLNDIYNGGVESIEKGLSGWKLDVFQTINKIDKNTFSSRDVYKFEEELHGRHPKNFTVKPKIRQQLQFLRALDLIEFLGNGRYRKKYVN